jgi:hypothetical protein
MSNEEHPSSVEEVREKVLRFLAQCSFLPPDTKHQIECAVASALTALGDEKKEQARREHRAKAKKWYWNERKDIKEQLERIARSSIALTPPKITFRDFETCLCPHGWNWTYCESLGQSLIDGFGRKTESRVTLAYNLDRLRRNHSPSKSPT